MGEVCLFLNIPNQKPRRKAPGNSIDQICKKKFSKNIYCCFSRQNVL